MGANDEWASERTQLLASGEEPSLDLVLEARLPAIDPAIERQLRLGRLRRLIVKRSSELALLLGKDAEKLRALLALLEVRRRRSELAYLRTGYELGVAGPCKRT